MLQDGDVNQALVRYLILAELGYELAQHNAAYLLDRGDETLFADDTVGRLHRALFYYKRSAAQVRSPILFLQAIRP